MKKIAQTLMFSGALIALTSFQTVQASEATAEAKTQIVELYGKNGDVLGTVHLDEAAHGLVATVEVTGIDGGWHGFHVHEKGDCSNTEDFSSAGGHAMMHDGEMHGVMVGDGHMGDLPNIWASEGGAGKAQFFTKLDVAQLKNEDGSAFILHAGTDDYKDVSSAGPRIACGVIFAPEAE